MPTKGGATAKSKSAASRSSISKGRRPPDELKSPQPQLSDLAQLDLRNFLNKADKPFAIATLPNTKKRKREASTYNTQEDLWEERLSVLYEVRPKDRWESLRRYKKFTVGTESIATGECVLIKHDDATEDQRIDVAAQWKAKVLEVRALDQEHVYLRVAWLNRPEDLSGGRKPHHGKNELIPTNQLDIIDAMAVNGTVDIVHWKDDDDSAMMTEDQFFWRQTYDYANTRTFSKLRQICIDRQPHNPDELIIQCSQESCRKWLHVRCIADNAVQQAYDEFHPKSKSAQKSSKEAVTRAIKSESPALDLKLSSLSLAQARAQKHGFTADVYIKGLPAVPPDGAAPETSSSTTTPNTSDSKPPSATSSSDAVKSETTPTPAANDTPMPDAAAATTTPDRSLAHTVANAFTVPIMNAISTITKSGPTTKATSNPAATATAPAGTVNVASLTPTPASSNSILLTRPDGTKKIEPLRCLFCEVVIED